MYKQVKTTFIKRIKNAIRGFKGSPLSIAHYGVDIKRCDQCEYKTDQLIRESLLVTAGARAAYMDSMGYIDLPQGVEGEQELSYYLIKVVGSYISQEEYRDVSYDDYIETALTKAYRVNKEE